MLSCSIDTCQRRDVASMDLPGVFLQAYLRKHSMENNMKEVIMCLKGNLADLVVMVKPNLYHKYLTNEKKVTDMLYVTIKKSLYGLLSSAIVFHKTFLADLNAYELQLTTMIPLWPTWTLTVHK